MELHEIRYFIAVARTLNFTRAAELCNVSQPALTRGIQKLEAELGGPLVARERSHTHLTELGRMMLPHFQEVLARTEAARENAQRLLRLEAAELTIGIMCSVGPLRFQGPLRNFRAANPGVTVTLTEGVPERLSEQLLNGAIDAAIAAHPAGFEAPLVAEPLYDEPYAIACPPTHRFAHRTDLALAELDGEDYLSRLNCEYRDVLQDAVDAAGARLLIRTRSEREDWIQAMVAAGMGICFLPRHALFLPGIALCRLAAPGIQRQVCLVSVAGRARSVPLRRFAEALHLADWQNPA